MNQAREEAQRHYDSAVELLEQMNKVLLYRGDDTLLTLLQDLRRHTQQAFWQAQLGQCITQREIAATSYCRKIPLTPQQACHLDELQRGMYEAEQSLTPAGRSAPWNALFAARQRIMPGRPRNSFEAGFLIRLFQLLQQACAERERGA